MVYSKVDGVETTYEIGLDGLRCAKDKEGLVTSYDLDENGQVITEEGTEIIWGDRALAKKTGSTYYYYIYNGHGDVVMLVDFSGNTKNTYTYDPWGKISSKSETVSNNIKYAGEYFDAETGLIYLRNR